MKVRLGDLKFRNGRTMEEAARYCTMAGDCEGCEYRTEIECQLLPDFRDLKKNVSNMMNYEMEIPQTAATHGKWYTSKPQDGKQRGLCSECGHIVTMAAGKVLNYCPQCGAKMDRTEESEAKA